LKNANTISLYSAIDQMRKISERKGHFSFSFMSYSRSDGSSHGIVQVDKARLRSGNPDEANYGDYLLNFVDLNTGKAFQCWKPCLMIFDSNKIFLK